MKTILYTVTALIAFAANSVLCRMALHDGAIDASSFTAVRLLSGAAVLAILIGTNSKSTKKSTSGSWIAALMLFLYAATFSYAYISLDTGVGALVLFAAVQMTIIFASLITGHKLHISEWLGITVAFSGFVYLILPSLTAPTLSGFILMSIAGVAWGLYTLNGRGSRNPLGDTASNFLRTTPLVIVLVLLTLPTIRLSLEGAILAITSGALASGAGYTVWYMALNGLSKTEAAVVQLSVPVIAAIGGVLFLFEVITMRLIYSSLMILGGILTVVLGRYFFIEYKTKN